MCRHEMGEMERLPEEKEEDEEEDEDDEEEEEEDQRFIIRSDDIPDFDDGAHALWVFRKTFQMLDENDSIAAAGLAEAPGEDDDFESLLWRSSRCCDARPLDGYETA
jgi:hypothetical protein